MLETGYNYENIFHLGIDLLLALGRLCINYDWTNAGSYGSDTELSGGVM